MKLMKKMAVGLSAVGLLAVAAPVYALPTLNLVTPVTGFPPGPFAGGLISFDPFSGFDYSSSASSVTKGLNFVGAPITTTYLASTSTIDKVGGGSFTSVYLNNDGSNPNLLDPFTYEITVKATIIETAVCLIFSGPICAKADFFATGGTYDIYYDSTPNANRALGSGYVDGTRIISGQINAGYAGQFTISSPTDGSGNFAFTGNVTFTETDNTKDAWINPALISSIAGAEIKIGPNTTTAWTAPTAWIDGGGIAAGDLITQADGNQSFRYIPEPGTLALLGLSLMGLGFTARRRKG